MDTIRCAIHPSSLAIEDIEEFCFILNLRPLNRCSSHFVLTSDERFRKFDWDIFQAIETHCRVETGGYASVWNVDAVPVARLDNMETFFLVRQSIVYTERARY